MRNLIVTVVALAAIVGCGPSGKEVAMAKQARYQGDKLALFGAMKDGVEAKYKLEVSDETKLALKTIARWYTPEGVASNWSPEDGRGSTDATKKGIPDRSLNISLVAQLLPEQGSWVVHIEPVILRYNEGRPNFDKVTPDDPSLPGFVQGKVDQLAYDINQKLKAYEVKTTGGIAPAPNTPAGPSVAPDVTPAATPAPSTDAPAEGSGAATPAP